MKKVFRFLRLWIAVTLLLGVVGAAPPPAADGSAKAHPMLVQMAAEQPGQRVAVIVQKLAEGAEAAVVSLGGQVTKDLSIINAFAAEMGAAAAVKLAGRPDVRWVSLDAPVVEAGGPDGMVDTSRMLNTYIRAIHSDDLWAEGYQGSSVTVAVIDSGMNKHNDFKTRILTSAKFTSSPVTTSDSLGHGTHIAGIIGGNGANSIGKYIGVAPKVKLINLKVSDDQGQSFMSDIVAGLQWVYDKKATYNIRVVNLSLNSTVAESYHTSPLNAALEILWFNGVVTVVSAGNNGTSGMIYPPANDPFVITVGAVDDKGTTATSDDSLASFSAYGTTESNFSKPDLVAPGKNIISALASTGCILSTAHPDHRVPGASTYFSMSGSSMASAVVAGAVALLLQDEPGLTPDQVKYRLMATARPFGQGNGAGYLDIYAAVKGSTTQSANTGKTASQLLWTGSDPVTWGSVSWNSVSWNSVSWNSVSWNSVSWNSVSWNSDYWGP